MVSKFSGEHINSINLTRDGFDYVCHYNCSGRRLIGVSENRELAVLRCIRVIAEQDGWDADQKDSGIAHLYSAYIAPNAWAKPIREV